MYQAPVLACFSTLASDACAGTSHEQPLSACRTMDSFTWDAHRRRWRLTGRRMCRGGQREDLGDLAREH